MQFDTTVQPRLSGPRLSGPSIIRTSWRPENTMDSADLPWPKVAY